MDANRARVLLQAMVDLFEQQNRSHYVLNILETTAVWDDAVRDGRCLLEDARDLLAED